MKTYCTIQKKEKKKQQNNKPEQTNAAANQVCYSIVTLTTKNIASRIGSVDFIFESNNIITYGTFTSIVLVNIKLVYCAVPFFRGRGGGETRLHSLLTASNYELHLCGATIPEPALNRLKFLYIIDVVVNCM